MYRFLKPVEDRNKMEVCEDSDMSSDYDVDLDFEFYGAEIR